MNSDKLVSMVALNDRELLVYGIAHAPTVRTRAAKRQSQNSDVTVLAFRLHIRHNEEISQTSEESRSAVEVCKHETLTLSEDSAVPPNFLARPAVVPLPEGIGVLFTGSVRTVTNGTERLSFGSSVNVTEGKREHSWASVRIDGERPSPRAYHTAVALKAGRNSTVALSFGGTSLGSDEPVKDLVWVLTMHHHAGEGLGGSWHRVRLEPTAGQLPRSASRMAACSVGKRQVYLHGGIGQDGRPLSDFWLLSFSPSYDRARCTRIGPTKVSRCLPRASHTMHYVQRRSIAPGSEGARNKCLVVLGGTEPQCVEWISLQNEQWYRSEISKDIVPPRTTVTQMDHSVKLPTTDGRVTILHHSSYLPGIWMFRTRPPLDECEIETSLARLASFKSIAHLLHYFQAVKPPCVADSVPETLHHQLVDLGHLLGGNNFLFEDGPKLSVILSVDSPLGSINDSVRSAVKRLATSVASQAAALAVAMTAGELSLGFTSRNLDQELDESVWASAASGTQQEELFAVLRLIRRHAPQFLNTDSFRALMSGYMAGINRSVVAIIIADPLRRLMSAVEEDSQSDNNSVKELADRFEMRCPFPLESIAAAPQVFEDEV
ncbi:hypothetical protein FOL47_009397 [Perkinsus chesapeaki]|uniref:Uncharacterized protein n=1 Tax=Perkinsus chesapeaki TaxID=330153 RepID=A0A7J6L8N4_PERCH|nr:hypothetical protein FOL47_009397 [Perkinsus chesapeaki]